MIISNTQVTAYNTCTKQHDYRFVDGIEPKLENLSFALYRGIVGHEALEAYYKLLMDGHSVDECKKAAKEVISNEMTRMMTEHPESFDHIKVLAGLLTLIDAYAEYYRVEPFKVLAVEKVFTAPLDTWSDNKYGLKLDTLIEMVTGKYRGDIIVMDHKFVYNFKSQSEIEMNAQLPKYIKTVKANGIHISRGIFNQIRYRSLKAPNPEDIFQRTYYKAIPQVTETIWNEQIEATYEIIDRAYKPRRIMSDLICKGCYFQSVCYSELAGQDTTNMRITNFQPNTYGYVEMADS